MEVSVSIFARIFYCTIYSKIERSERKVSKDQIHLLEQIFGVEKNCLMIPYLSEKIYFEISEEDCAGQVLKIAVRRSKTVEATGQGQLGGRRCSYRWRPRVVAARA